MRTDECFTAPAPKNLASVDVIPNEPIAAPFLPTLLDVRQTAGLLGVSECWVRRHKELPTARVGRLIRFDSALLLRKFQGKVSVGNRLKPEGTTPMVYKQRFQHGSILKRGKRGRQVWYGIWREDSPNPDGGFVRRQRFVRLGNLSELPNRSMARERLSRLMNLKPSVEMPFSELVQRWTELVVPTLKDSSAALYLYNLKRYVGPVFGSQSVSKIDREDVERFLARMAKMYCRNTLRAMRASLSKVLSWAVEHKWIAENPCSGVKLPRSGTKVKRAVLTPDNVKAIVSELDEPYATLVLFLSITGLRVGEAVGIKWADFDGEFLHIQRRIYERREGTLKTDGSSRSIPVPFSLLERMRALRSFDEKRGISGTGDWVFKSRNGTPVDPKNAGNRYLRPTVRKLGIAMGGWHDFRHTFATQLLKQRHSAKMVAELLGHSDVETTLKTYTHPEREDFRAPLNERAAELLANVIKCPVLQSPANGKMLN